MPIDPDLLELLERTADLAATKTAGAVSDELVSREEFDDLKRQVGALVQPTTGKDGEVIYIARRIRLSLSAVLSLATAFGLVCTPIIVALLSR